MILPDLNLLLYAYNPQAPQYKKAMAWWENVINSKQAILLPYEILFGFIRIATNKRLGEACVSLKQAKNTVDSWLNMSHTKIITPDQDHYSRVLNLMSESKSQGPVLSDAILASYAIQHGATLCSNDDDFKRFKGLIYFNPIQ
jgi:toxin-antitoxin system PIN domain toxin|tara:strand:- start:363 stop:791 length:429 start_codon:yes stop_codon:yes gene_type:complete